MTETTILKEYLEYALQQIANTAFDKISNKIVKTLIHYA